MSRKSPSSDGGLSFAHLPLAVGLAALMFLVLPNIKASTTNTATALPPAPYSVPHSDELQNNTKVAINPIPEPGSIALAAGALSIVLWKTRRAR